jgi:anti-sigma regulatory factor (Ser/Thr protein kinase)
VGGDIGVLERRNTLEKVSSDVRRRMSADTVSPAEARRIVRSTLDGWDADDIKLVELLTSELVTNAVRHAATEIVFCVEVALSTVRVEVSDAGTTMPHIRDDDQIGGYGLRIVEALATRWGVDLLPGAGKTVWFEVDRGECARTPVSTKR